MSEQDNHWDAVVVGTGSGGTMAATLLADQGLRVLAVERGRVGGECHYVACVPAKELLLSAFAGLSWAETVQRRDEAAGHRDDSAGEKALSDKGIEVLRGEATLRAAADGRHRLHVVPADGSGPTTHTADRVVVATGSRPAVPDVDGLDEIDYWTSDVALSTDDQPESLVILGGGAVGCELAQAFQRLGTEVTLVEVQDTLLPPEPAWVGELLAKQLTDDGVTVRTGVTPKEVAADQGGFVLRLDDGATVRAARVLVAGGRRPNTEDLGLTEVGAATDDGGAVRIDPRCRVTDGSGRPVDGLYAVGDVTAESAYTHSANHQARVVATDVAGRPRDADYRAIPRAVYTQPTVFGVGMTPDQARDAGKRVRTTTFDLSDTERADLVALAHEPGRAVLRGRLELTLDADEGILLGAACVGPEADSWGAELTLAVQARVPVEELRWTVRAFPSWSEVVTAALDELAG